MKKAIFLDRDGVINKKKSDHVKSVEEFQIFPFAIEAIKKINQLGFLVIIITNQSAINRGLMTHHDLDTIHQELQKSLKKNSGYVDAFYYCPHRSDENCTCRKPKSGLIKKAIDDFGINIENSWVIGDSEIDMEAGKSINCKTLKVDSTFNLLHAIDYISSNNEKSC